MTQRYIGSGWLSVFGTLAALTFSGEGAAQAPAQPAKCVPACRAGYQCVDGTCTQACPAPCAPNETCADGRCVSACNPACPAGQVCTPNRECVSACNPPCAANQVCDPAGQCISACNPPCPGNEVCNPSGQCVSACNPPCGAGQECTNQGACVATAPAAPPPAFQPMPVEQQEPPGKGVRKHDGFYMRLGIGVGSASMTVEESFADVDLTGIGPAGEIAFGTTIAPGFALGGGIYGTTIPEPEYEALGQTETGGAVGASTLALFGDYYINPEKGFHLQGAAGYTLLTSTKGDNYPGEDSSGGGFGLLVGAGYDWWVGEQWSLGLLGRVHYVSGTVTGEDSDEDVDVNGTVIAALLTATLH